MFSRCLVLLLFLTIGITFPVMAQDNVPEQEATEELPISELVFNWYAEVIFPQGVRFFVTPLIPMNEIREAVLTVQPEGQPQQVIPIDFSEPLQAGEGFTDLAHLWEFAPEMPLFHEITYQWRITGTSGQVASVRDRMLLTDQRAQWSRDEDPLGFINLTVPAEGLSPRQIRQNVLLAYNLISANTRRTQAFNIVLYHDDLPASGCLPGDGGAQVAVAPLSGVQVPCDEGRALEIYAANGYQVVQSRAATLAGIQAAMIEFFTHQFYAPIWGSANVPDWFKVGLAQFYVPAPKAGLLGTVQNMARSNQLLDLEDMSQGPASYNTTWRAQSYAMVLYIADMIGVQGLYDLAYEAGTTESSFQATYEAAVGQGLNALLPNLRRWIFTEGATRAFGYTPYQAETPTTTVTATVTPSRTASPTLTATATLTPSVTGVLTETPTATRTPSRTPTLRPATITPRPAGSLFTPTPVPPPNPLSEPTTQTGLLAVLFAALAVVGALYLFIRRRDEL